MTIFKHEWKINVKTFLIWALLVAVLGGGCLSLYPLMDGAMKDMADVFGTMGAFSQAFGLDQLSIGTPEGFFSTEVGNVYSLGGSMFAALLGIGLLAKEEGGHTADFLYTLPLGRISIFAQKYITMISMFLGFGIINFLAFEGCLLWLGEEISFEILVKYIILQFILQLEIATISYLISAVTKRVQMGVGLGIAFIFYMLDIVSRIAEEITFLKYFTPFYYANASDLFINDGDIAMVLVGISLSITIVCLFASAYFFQKKDLAT